MASKGSPCLSVVIDVEPLVDAKIVESDAGADKFSATVESHFEWAPKYPPATDKLAKGALDVNTHLGLLVVKVIVVAGDNNVWSTNICIVSFGGAWLSLPIE